MKQAKVDDIIRGRLDVNECAVRIVYYKVPPLYAIYATEDRVLIQFADESMGPLALEQRKALSPLAPLRGEINGLIEDWRRDRQSERAHLFAEGYDRLTADALLVALQGDPASAQRLLQDVRDRIVAERTSTARGYYVLSALAAAVVLITALSIAAAFSGVIERPGTDGALLGFAANDLWTAAAIGAVGAFLSVALAARHRQLKTDLGWRDNTIDATLRIVIGAISGGVLFCILASGLLGISLGGEALTVTTLPVLIVVAIIAGFSERLVGGLLEQGAATIQSGRSGEPVPMADARTSNERNPLGTSEPATMPAPRAAGSMPASALLADNDDERALSDEDALHQVQAEAWTSDIELPVSSGGISRAA